MSKLKATGIGLATILVCATIFAMMPDKPETSDDTPDHDNAQSFAVIELFTSEGCSSCPPADKVLAGLVEDSRKDGRPART